MQEIVIKIRKEDKEALGTVRCVAGLQVAEDDVFLWVRGIDDTAGNTRVKQLPAMAVYTLDSKQGHLFEPGALTPVAILPVMEWQDIKHYINLEWPVSVMPGNTSRQLPLKIVPSSVDREGYALLTSLDTWKRYAETASAIRLASLQFAVSTNREVLITGHPLPSLPGKEWWMEQDILIPCGYDFENPFMATYAQQYLNAGRKALMLFDEQGSWQKVDKTFLMEARRSAIRLTRVDAAAIPDADTHE